MVKLDKINCEILNILQEDCRTSLTDIAKKVGLSVDSVKKRYEKLKREKIFFPKIQMRPRYFGFDNIVEVKIKLQNYTAEKHKEFTTFIINNPRIIEIIAISGEWDYSMTFIAKNTLNIGNFSEKIRNKFNDIITKWTESLTTKVYRFEKYDMVKIMDLEE